MSFDAVVSTDEALVGVSVVIRNSNGDFVVALSKRINASLCPASAEALATFYASDFALSCGFFEALFEGDAQSIIKFVGRI